MKTMQKYIMVALVAACSLSVNAQQVNTLYFLENAPMRHTINPAFKPVSRGYINFTPIGWTSLTIGNNSLTMSDVIMVDPITGRTITALHPNNDRQAFINTFKTVTLANQDFTLGLINMGFGLSNTEYLTIGINERVLNGVTIPKNIPNFVLNGGMTDLNGGTNTFNMTGLGFGTTVYTEIGVGYSRTLNDKWTIGGKVKLLLGQAYAGMNTKNLAIDASATEWYAHGNLDIDMASNLNTDYMTKYMSGKTLQGVINGFKDGSFNKDSLMTDNIASLLTPAGYGAAIDFGFTYKPLEYLQINAALVDLGFIYWTKTSKVSCSVDTTFYGAGDIEYSDPRFHNEEGKFSTSILMDSVGTNLRNMLDGFKLASAGNGSLFKMVSARLNVGVDANFWNNRVGVGIVSATRLYNSRIYEEVTVGASFRPYNWISLAASYSLIDNGKFSNIGAGLSIMPYDGINLTVAMDYIPTSYAAMPGTQSYVLPYKTKMFNIAFGFTICWGSNYYDRDNDGIYDKFDLAPNTPKGIKVDSKGRPMDEDHDGVPDHIDQCLGTPAAAIGFVDSLGCELDTDGDGIEDYRDKCPNTPEASWGLVDSTGCPLDSDRDSVPDYLDACPNTPEEAIGKVDENGCPLDSDYDGVPDYIDMCPDTPKKAFGKVDDNGCPLDSDGDGVPDYLDECPNTPSEDYGHIDEKGCTIDTDGDGVPDYMDECPQKAGSPEKNGCPEVKREVRQLLQKAMQGIEFESGKATIKQKSYQLLDEIALIFIENEDYIIEVQGHTDNTGKADFNKKISEQRAKAVMEYLKKKGVQAERMTAVGYGQERPIADNDTKDGRQKNRRVEFNITFEEVQEVTVVEKDVE